MTQVLAEKHPDWVSGAAPLCGVLGGPEANLNLALDVSYSLKALFNPALKLTGYTSWDEAVQNWVATAKIVQDQLTGAEPGRRCSPADVHRRAGRRPHADDQL